MLEMKLRLGVGLGAGCWELGVGVGARLQILQYFKQKQRNSKYYFFIPRTELVYTATQ